MPTDKKAELIIFDMDGLLFDTERLFMNLKGTVLEEYGYEHREEDYIRTIGTAGETLHAILHEIYGPDYPADAISRRTRELVDQSIEENGPPVKPGIPELLAVLAEQKIPCCVATSTDSSVAASYIKKAGLTPYFSFIIGGDLITRSKPDPEIFLKACGQAGVRPENALVFEDSENGILAADAAGIPVICIPDLKEPSVEIAAKTLAVLNNAGEAASFLRLEKS